MSFTWFADKPLLSREEIAGRVHQIALGRGLDELATVIALMTISTEVGTGSGEQRRWWCPANPAVAGSVDYPHDSLSNDNRSMGYFQQQPGPNGEPWWGTTADMMTVESAANTFLGRLSDDYRRAASDPYLAGVYAQQVQQSAYPDRYARAWNEAWAVLNRAITLPPAQEITVPDVPALDYGITKRMHGFNPESCAACTGNSNGPRAHTLYVVVHTQEAHSTAVDLADFCNNSRITQPDNPVSYNLVVDDHDTIEIVPVNQAPWAAAAANDIGVHICFAGSFASWSAGKWLETDASDGLDEDAMLTRGAQAAAAACRQYGIPAVYAGDDGESGWPILPSGIVGHRDFGARGGGHTDPGDGFPMTEFLRRVNNFLNPTTPGGTVPAPSNDAKIDYIYGQLQPYPQLAGKPDALDELRRKIADGVDLTLVDAVAAHIHGLFGAEVNR